MRNKNTQEDTTDTRVDKFIKIDSIRHRKDKPSKKRYAQRGRRMDFISGLEERLVTLVILALLIPAVIYVARFVVFRQFMRGRHD